MRAGLKISLSAICGSSPGLALWVRSLFMRLDIYQLCLVRQRRGAPLPPLSAEHTTLEGSDLNSHGHNHPKAALDLGGAEAALETVPTLRDGMTPYGVASTARTPSSPQTSCPSIS